MLISDSYSDKTSSTLPIIISFSSNYQTKKIKKIREFLRHNPNCQKYVTKGPNFVADGINEFRLFYVDSSLYADEITLKKLNVEKEEIVFRSTTEDSLEPSVSSKNNKFPLFYSNEKIIPNMEIKQRTTKFNKATICTPNSYTELRCCASVVENPQVANKVSKSFQIGPDLRFNVVYVNTDMRYHTFNYKEASVQTEQIEHDSIQHRATSALNADSSVKIPMRGSPSFLFGGQSNSVKPEKKHRFKTFCTRMEEKRAVSKLSDDSEFNFRSRSTSVKFSIKKSPSFVANFILEILNGRKSNGDIIERSIVNYIKYDDLKNRVSAKGIHEMGTRNDIMKYDCEISKQNEKSPYRDEAKNYKHRKNGEKRKTNKYSKNGNKVDKFLRYHNIGRASCYKVESLFKCTNMDFFFKKSHYAILKNYHRKLQDGKHRCEKHNQHYCPHMSIDRKYTENKNSKNNDYNKNKFSNQNQTLVMQNCQDMSHHRRISAGDSNTRGTISGFLQSYRPWHWQDNSKLSICIHGECLNEENLHEKDLHINSSSYQCKMSEIRKYFYL